MDEYDDTLRDTVDTILSSPISIDEDDGVVKRSIPIPIEFIPYRNVVLYGMGESRSRKMIHYHSWH